MMYNLFMNEFFENYTSKKDRFRLNIHFINISIILIGIFLRLKYYCENQSFWLDEAYLAISITSRSFKEILTFQPVFYDQPIAPMFFSIIIKTCTSIFGNNEMVLRVFPLFSGIISLFLFYKFLKCYGSSKYNMIALGLFALCDSLVYYSAELKPYSTDVMVALVLYLFMYYFLKNRTNIKIIRSFGVVGALCMWLSHTSIFILGSFFIVQCMTCINSKQWDLLLKHLIMYLVWMLGFVLLYRNSLSQMVSSKYILDTWGSAFMPFNSGFLPSCKWILMSLLNVFKYPLNITYAPISLGIFLLGLIHSFKNNKERTLLLITPLAIVLFAAMLHKYPFEGRMILFLIPSLILFVSEGVLLSSKIIGKVNEYFGVLLIIFFLFQPVKTAVLSLYNPRLKDENRKAVNYIAKNIKKGDLLLLNSSAQYPWWYYFGQMGLSERMQKEYSANYDRDFYIDSDVIKIFDQISSFRGVPYAGLRFENHAYNKNGLFRVSIFSEDPNKIKLLHMNMAQNAFNSKHGWVFLSNLEPTNEAFILKCLDKTGRRIEHNDFKNASVTLYDFY